MIFSVLPLSFVGRISQVVSLVNNIVASMENESESSIFEDLNVLNENEMDLLEAGNPSLYIYSSWK